MKVSIRSFVAVTLSVATGLACAAPTEAASNARAIDFAVTMRALLVDQAHALRDVMPNDLRARVLLSPAGSARDATGMLIVGTDPELPVLVEQARGSTDPLVLALLMARCGHAVRDGGCDAAAFAQRWIDADTQNQAAWLALGFIQSQRGDEAGAKATFVRASRASVWHGHYTEAARYLLRLLPRDLAPSDRTDAIRAVTAAASTTLQFAHAGFLSAQCKDAALLEACDRILAVMARDADDLADLSIATKLSRRYVATTSIVDARLQAYDATYTGLLLAPPPAIDDDRAVDADYAAFNAAMEARITRGEVAQARIDYTAAGLTEETAAARYRVVRVQREERSGEFRGRAP